LERGAELSPLLLLRARRRGRGRGWQERSGAPLVGLQELSPRCRRGLLSRKASFAGGDKAWGALRRRPAPAAAGLMLRRRRWWCLCEVASCCWVGLRVGAAAVLRSVSVSMLLYLSLTPPSLAPFFLTCWLQSPFTVFFFCRFKFFFVSHFGFARFNTCRLGTANEFYRSNFSRSTQIKAPTFNLGAHPYFSRSKKLILLQPHWSNKAPKLILADYDQRDPHVIEIVFLPNLSHAHPRRRELAASHGWPRSRLARPRRVLQRWISRTEAHVGGNGGQRGSSRRGGSSPAHEKRAARSSFSVVGVVALFPREEAANRSSGAVAATHRRSSLASRAVQAARPLAGVPRWAASSPARRGPALGRQLACAPPARLCATSSPACRRPACGPQTKRVRQQKRRGSGVGPMNERGIGGCWI
jgi:hypothetical protein